jgi:ABC-2 type transport system ATP-binding protein
MWDIVRELVAAGTTILLTTQYLEEADQLADRVAVLDRGRIVADGTPSELKRLVPGGRIHLEFDDERVFDAAAAALPDASRNTGALALDVPSDGSFASIRTVMDRLDAQQLEARSLTIHTPDLDDVFLALTR